MAIEGEQIKVKFPYHQLELLERYSKDTAVPVASLVRIAVAEWCKGKDGEQDMRALAQAFQSGVITANETAERLVMLVERAAAG